MSFFQNNQFTVMKDDGTQMVCDILFTFDNEETGKSYVVYTDNTHDETGNVQVFASVYDPSGENLRLMPIETEQEWKIIETILSTLQEEIQRKAGQNVPTDDDYDTIIEEE